MVARVNLGAALGLNSLTLAGLTFCDVTVVDVIAFPPPRTPNILLACDVIEKLGIPLFSNGEVGRQAAKLVNGDWTICRCLAASFSSGLAAGFIGENPWKAVGRKGLENPPMKNDAVPVGSTFP